MHLQLFNFLTNNILSALNDKLLVGGVFCDLQKAFDCDNHIILLPKMEFYGISGKANNLIRSYLQERLQRILIDYVSRKYSFEWETVTHEIPQSSILCPILVLLHINNLPETISDISNPILFADDRSMIITNSALQVFKRKT